MSTFSLAEYHRHPAWSPTALKAAVTGTMRAWSHRFGPGAAPFVPSPDMVKGDLVDALLTPPFCLDGRFKVFSTIARNTKVGAANCAEAEAAGLGEAGGTDQLVAIETADLAVLTSAAIKSLTTPYWVSGPMKIGSKTTRLGAAAYTGAGSTIEPYKN